MRSQTTNYDRLCHCKLELMQRREFLKHTGILLGAGPALAQTASAKRVALVIDPADKIASAAPVQWAANELKQSLAGQKIEMATFPAVRQVPAGYHPIRVAGSRPAGFDDSERIDISPTRSGAIAVVSSTDARGLTYGLLELADQARHGANILAHTAVHEKPANAVRSVTRLFVSDVEDKPWFNDREMWPEYLTMLANARFNRFSLALGIGYDFLREVTDSYFVFSYPYFLDVPGYKVRASNLPDSERDQNLEMIKYISEQTVARGMDFQLGLWMHGYQWTNSPNANHVIEGLTPETHGAYCRDALAMLLKACPAISGVTFRVHGESGVNEGSYDFWKMVFDGVARSGRKVGIDMHAKGLEFKQIELAVATGMPVTVSPKFWAEHMGMPYHQADIRPQEYPRKSQGGLMAVSAGERNFTRYGYADLLREDKVKPGPKCCGGYDVVHRIWPGTQRLLLWGDPVFAAAYSRAFSFCASKGVEWMEPLSFKGRRGSGLPGGRDAYADASLKPRWDWQKYEYSYRMFGRALYNPSGDPDGWRRVLKAQVGAAAPEAEAALANASRILPTITSAHGPSAANNTYWPEVYTNQPIVEAGRNPYTDTPAPKVFGNAGAFDPQMFSSANEFADELLTGERSGKYSPIAVAAWLDDLASKAEKLPSDPPGVQFRRLAEDVRIQAALGRFFAAKFRAAVLFRIHEKAGDRAALEEALKYYRSARAIWETMANRAKTVYVADITVGEHPWLRGHWANRLGAIDSDIADMAKRLDAAKSTDDPKVRAAIAEVAAKPAATTVACRHTAPTGYRPGLVLPLELTITSPAKPGSVRLWYRHVTQAERWVNSDMQHTGNVYRATIAADYTNTPHSLEYYFEVKESAGRAWLYPGFGPDLTNQPYFVVRGAGDWRV